MILTDRRKCQAITNIMYGLDPGLDHALLEGMEDKYYDLWQFVRECRSDGLDHHDIYQELIRLKQQKPDGQTVDIIEHIFSMDPGQTLQYETLESVGSSLPPVSWLWPGWIPRGYLTTLAAEPGVGKSHLSLDLFRRVIHRLKGPDQQPLQTRSGSVIYVEAENFLAAIYQRAQQMEIDLSRLYVLRRQDDEEMLDLGSQRYKDQLLEMCYDIRPDLIVIDSFSTVQTKGENSVEDIRGVLNFLANIATHFTTAVVLLHHLRKPQRESTYSRVTQHDLRGSSHIAAMTRSLLGMWITSLDLSGPRRLEVIKTNLISPPLQFPPPLISRYQAAGDGGFEIVYEHISQPTLPENLSGQCAEWLEQTLAETGPLSYLELRDMADEVGYKENTLQKAKSHLDWKVVDTVGAGKRGNKWALYNRNGRNGANIMLHGSHGHVTHPPPQKTTPPSTTWPCEPCDSQKPAKTRPLWKRLPPGDPRQHPLHRGPNGHPRAHPLFRERGRGKR